MTTAVTDRAPSSTPRASCGHVLSKALGKKMTEHSPFLVGKRYRVRRGYSELNHAFRQGEEVIFTSHAYSPKEGLTRYWFRGILSGETNIWHYSDGNSIDGWKEIFEEVNEPIQNEN